MLYEVKDEHKKVVEMFLSSLSVADEDIKCIGVVVIRKDGICLVNYEDATIEDLIQMQGNIGMAITKRYMEMNWPSVINDDNLSAEDDE